MRTIVIPDVHVPFHHRKSVAKLFDCIRREKPDKIVLLGDVMDFHALSIHRQDPRWQDNLDKEVRAGRRFLKSLRDAGRKAEIFYIEGNHEDRWNRFVAGRVPVLRMLGISWENALGLNDHGIQLSRNGVEIPCGQGKTVLCMHGHEIKGNSTLPAGKALKMAKEFGCNVHIGHTHRMGLVATTVGKLDLFAVEGGYLGDRSMPGFAFMGPKRRPTAWKRGWAIYDSNNTDTPFPRLIKLP